jgi:hypothetical protein
MSYESVLLKLVDELAGELNGVFTARKLVSYCDRVYWGAWVPLARQKVRTARRHAA